MKRKPITVYHDKLIRQWCVLDSYGWSVMWFDKPSLARTARHLYRAYLDTPCDVHADRIVDMIKGLK